MKLNELFEQYKQMPPMTRRLILIMPVAAMMLYALMTAPRIGAPVRDTPTAAYTAPNCDGAKMHMSVFGRSLFSYDWQSGNCLSTSARPRT